MAEEAANSNSSATVEPQEQKSGWWGGFFDTVKKKSEVILNAYKEDLTEFASSIKSDAQKVVASDLTSTISNQINKITETISTLITDDKNSGTTERSSENYTSKLEALQTSSETFTMKPEDVAFFQWTETFDVEARSEEISKILANNSQISEMYHQMVPSMLSMKEFWGRYFYKLEKINQEETRRAALVKKAEELQQKKEDELALGWGDDDDSETQTPATDNSNTDNSNTNESAPTEENKHEEGIKDAESAGTPTESSADPADKEEKIIPDSEGDKKSEGGDDDIFSWS
jgi:hypothetical protein